MALEPSPSGVLLGSGGLAWLELERVSALPAADGCTLTFETELCTRDRIGDAVVDLRLSMRADLDSHGWHHLGTAIASQPTLCPPSGTELRARRVSFDLPIDAATIEVIEQGRRGLDLNFVADIAGWAIGTRLGTAVGSTQERWRVKAADWAAVLDQGGSHRHLMILVAAPSTESSKRLKDADAALQDARQALREGRYRDAIRDARLGIEVLGLKRTPPSNEVRKLRSVAERYSDLAGELFDLASVSAHSDGPNVDHRSTRSEAITTLAGLMMLIQWVAEQEASA